MTARARQWNAGGFSLLEIAIVLVIISILLTIVVLPLSTQLEQQRTVATNKQLELIKEALIGFAIANGRLPCPAITTSLGAEKFTNVGNAANGGCQQFVGLVPAVTLGLSPVDNEGFVVDGWGLTQNRILYGVSNRTVVANSPPACSSTVSTPILTSTNGMRAATMSCLADPSALVTLLTICSTKPTGSPGAATACSALLTDKAPFVLLSLGKNAATGGTGADEAHNVDADSYFVSHTPTQSTAPGGEFDDIVTWGSLNTLFARMVQAGKLP